MFFTPFGDTPQSQSTSAQVLMSDGSYHYAGVVYEVEKLTSGHPTFGRDGMLELNLSDSAVSIYVNGSWHHLLGLVKEDWGGLT